jgi:hypothetical protein
MTLVVQNKNTDLMLTDLRQSDAEQTEDITHIPDTILGKITITMSYKLLPVIVVTEI